MKGQAVPLVLIPRYTSYLGSGEFTTVPLDVTQYAQACVTFWRGGLWHASMGATFQAVFQVSHDADEWFTVNPPGTITTTNTYGTFEVALSRRWFRIKIDLAEDNRVVGITCWATGLLERRIED